MDAVLKDAGSCGRFQIVHILCIQLIRCVSVWALYLMVFGNYEPAWQCRVKNGTRTNTSKSSSTASPTSERFVDANAFARFNTSVHVNGIISNTTMDNSTEIYFQCTCQQLASCDEIVFDTNSVTLVSEFGLICDQAIITCLILAVQMLGMLFGACAGGQLGEVFGRKVCIYTSMALTSVSTITAACSTSWQMYAALTFFIGLGVGGIEATLTVYAAEFLTSKWRGRFGAIPMWNISLLLFAFVIIGLKVWWQIHILCGVAAGIFLLCAIWTPESLRWLHVHGEDSEAKKVLTKMMRCNRRKQNLSEALMKLETAGQKNQVHGNRRYTYLDLFRTPDIRSRTIKLSIGWFSILLCYYTLGFSIKALSGDYYTNLLLSCVSEIPFVLLLGPCVNVLGRRVTTILFLSSTTMFTVACVITHYAFSLDVAGTVTRYLAILAKGCANVGWGAMVLFSTELFPTVVRNLAMGLFNTVARLGGIFAALIVPYGQDTTVISFFVLSGALIVASLVLLTLPETKNKPLVDEIQIKAMMKPELVESQV